MLQMELFQHKILHFLHTKAATAFSVSWPSQFCPFVRPSVCPSCHTGGLVENGAS